jgi:2-polyprenyl-3-methyl-5-hydroxy-6-metoxy-1,4-benzoquinol methylase
MLDKNFALASGERQIGKTIQEIRKDHTFRYELAIDMYRKQNSKKSANLLDIFCGNGYGSQMLAEAFENSTVTGIDGSMEAIDMANRYYTKNNNIFSWKIFPFSIPSRVYDFVTCFESLEHVEDDELMLLLILESLKADGVALISVPNQDLHPLEKNPHHFHFRHYKHDEFIGMIPEEYEITNWFGQNVYEFDADGVNTFKLLSDFGMQINEKIPGQVNVYAVCRRGIK